MSDYDKGVYRVCVVTSYPAAREPRAPKHVIATLEALPNAEVHFIDMAAAGENVEDPDELRRIDRLTRDTLRVPTRKVSPFSWAYRKLVTILMSMTYIITKVPKEAVFGSRAVGLTRKLKKLRADLYFAHNIDTLLPAAEAARVNSAKLIFDCMEFYSDMGDSQTTLESVATRALEKSVLPNCCLVLTTSQSLADALIRTYGIDMPLVLHNVPNIEDIHSKSARQGLRLYWRNSVIGFGQRGLDDILVAMTLLPQDVTLSLQGRMPIDNGKALRQRIADLGLLDRIHIHPPYDPGEAVQQAASHDVGLCLERRGPANHEYTVSNKLFDYMMAGLAVIVPDLDGLARVVDQAGAGLIFKAGSPESLAEKVLTYYYNRHCLIECSKRARAYAISEGNWNYEKRKLVNALRSRLGFSDDINKQQDCKSI